MIESVERSAIFFSTARLFFPARAHFGRPNNHLRLRGHPAGGTPLTRRGFPRIHLWVTMRLQWGADGGGECDNRFNGFPSAEQTVETVQFLHRSSGTPLKWGVNQTCLPFPCLAGRQVLRQVSDNRPHSEMRPPRFFIPYFYCQTKTTSLVSRAFPVTTMSIYSRLIAFVPTRGRLAGIHSFDHPKAPTKLRRDTPEETLCAPPLQSRPFCGYFSVCSC
jgi:hypothetical protein